MNDNARRAVRGYGVGAGIAVIAASASVGPFFPLGVVVGVPVALAFGLLIVAPVCYLLCRLGQLRPWWAALLGAVGLIAPLALMNPGFQGVDYRGVDRSYVLVEVWPTDEVTPNWTTIGITAFGALAGLAGWAAAYGFRLRPPPETTGDA
jgi:hypothetical protein